MIKSARILEVVFGGDRDGPITDHTYMPAIPPGNSRLPSPQGYRVSYHICASTRIWRAIPEGAVCSEEPAR